MSLQISIANTLGGRSAGGSIVTTPHISEWRTTTPSEIITLPYEITGTYTGIIDWGDGTQSVNSYANRNHTYATSGYYTITINGTIIGFNFTISTSKTKIYRVFQWGSNFNLGNNGACFSGCTNLNLSIVSDVLSTTNITTFSNIFKDCTSLTTINRINEWNITNITNLFACFINCTNFNQSLASWDTSNVTNMGNMFQFASNFNQPLANWNVKNVTNMGGMFNSAVSFNQPLANWERSTPDVSSLSNVASMTNMFQNITIFNQNIGNWNTSAVITMNGMFTNCSNFNQNIGSWNVGNVQNMLGMFQNASAFNQNIGSWNTISVTNASSMFRGATAFNQNIGNWDVRNCLNFTNFMFGKTFSNYSTANYDALLIGWASRPVKPNISINFGTIKRTIASTVSKLILTGPPNLWTIVDGGL